VIKVGVLASLNADKWNVFVERNSYATPYHLWEWGEALSSTYKLQRYYLAITKNNEITGILPLIRVKSLLFGDRLISLPFCEYGGPLVDVGLSSDEIRLVTEALLDAANQLARTLRVEYVEIRGSLMAGESTDVKGYKNFQRYVTFGINLEKELDGLWSGLHRSTRSPIRKAMRSGIEIKELEEVRQLEDYYQLYLETQKRHGSPPHKYELFKNLYEALNVRGKIKVLLANYHGKLIAGLIIFLHNRTIFAWNNVTGTQHRGLNPTNLLIWNVIEWGVRKGHRIFDLGRTRRGTTIHVFKRRWGGQETHLQDYVCFLRENVLPDPEQEKYRCLSKVWSFMPTSLTEKIGPKLASGIAL